MTFVEILQKLVDQTPGATGAALIASDGIPVEEYTRSTEADLSAVGAELLGTIEQATKASRVLGGGAQLDELVLKTAALQVVVRPVDDELILVVALEPGGLSGKARFLAAQLLGDLRACL